MRIAIDKGSLSGGHSVRGIGVMVREQIRALQEESKKDKALEINAVDFSKKDLSKYDIVHYPYFFPYYLTLPAEKVGKRNVVMVQDLIHLIYPNNYPAGIGGKINFFKQKLRLKNADAIITISETSKKDIVRFLGVEAEKVHVVYLAPKKIFKKLGTEVIRKVRRKYKLPNEFVLYVGDINYNKNIPNLIKACKIAKTSLVIAGKQALDIEDQVIELPSIEGPRDWIRFLFNIPHPELVHYEELLREFRGNNNIIRLGFVPDEDLVAIYNLATVCCQPSFYEGFGLIVLEAMACETPVIASKTQALVEIAGNAAIFIDPKNPKQMASKISRVIKDSQLRGGLVKKGVERISEYSWRKTARETIKIYKKVLAV